jgi:hypothetical protein
MAGKGASNVDRNVAENVVQRGERNIVEQWAKHMDVNLKPNLKQN